MQKTSIGAAIGWLALPGAVFVVGLFAVDPALAQDTLEAGPALNGCTEYVDRTAPDADRSMAWDYAIADDPARCMKIRVGQSVVFVGDRDAHPIDARGGDAANPFLNAFARPQDVFTFDRPGVFGYYCTLHEQMLGAIWVVE